MMDDDAETLTLLFSESGEPLTKRYWRERPGGPLRQADYPQVLRFRPLLLPFEGLERFADLLRQLGPQRDVCLVRGALAEGIEEGALIYRRSESEPRHLVERPRRLTCVDLDHLARPAGLDPLADPDGALDFMLGHLPEEFDGAGCVIQWSASAGMDGWATLRAHLWFELEQRIGNPALRDWALAWNELRRLGRLIDYALYSPVQPHYLAWPLLGRHAAALLGDDQRVFYRPGRRVPLALRTRTLSFGDDLEGGSFGGGGFGPGLGTDGLLALMGDGPGLRGFYEPIRGAVAAYVRNVGRELANRDAIYRRVLAAFENAPGEIDRKAAVKRNYLGRKFDSLFAGAVRKFG